MVLTPLPFVYFFVFAAVVKQCVVHVIEPSGLGAERDPNTKEQQDFSEREAHTNKISAPFLFALVFNAKNL